MNELALYDHRQPRAYFVSEKKKQFSKTRDDLLESMKRNRIDYAIVTPDDLQNSACANLETVIDLIKDEPKLYALGTLKITEIKNYLKHLCIYFIIFMLKFL